MKKINGKLGEEGVGRHSAGSSFFFYTGGKGRAAAKGFASNKGGLGASGTKGALFFRLHASPVFSAGKWPPARSWIHDFCPRLFSGIGKNPRIADP